MNEPPAVDLRSDTVTVPTPGMLQAMMAAEVGDDVYGEDPSVNRLQAAMAELLGKEDALFVPSGTMANLVAIKTHTQPGDQVILHPESHCHVYEGGGYAALAGLSPRFVEGERGILPPDAIPAAVNPGDSHFARSRLVVIENTHNRCGGSVYPLGRARRIGEVCREHGLRLHVDGARLFNACIAAGVGPAEYARHADSVAICLSKGLGCPVGSLLCGTRDFIERAHRVRKVLGGGMRQAGYLAAAGLYALEHHVQRLAEDHEHARMLADGIRRCAGLRLKHDPPETNMVYFDVLAAAPEGLLHLLERERIRIGRTGEITFRAVTHLGITREDVGRTASVLRANYA